MGSQPKVIRLSNSTLPSDEVHPEEEPPEKKPEPMIVGSIREKGFSAQTGKNSTPQPRVTAFPVARHRSEGPYWAPASRKDVQATMVDNGEDEGTDMVGFAEPLQKRKEGQSGIASQWRISRKAHPNERLQSEGIATVTPSVDRVRRATSSIEQSCEDAEAVISENGLQVKEKETLVTETRLESESRSDKGLRKCGMVETVSKEIDLENRKALFNMSSAEVAEAQAELSEKLRPELLELLRRRGLDKERKRLSEVKGIARSRVIEGVSSGTNDEAIGKAVEHGRTLDDSGRDQSSTTAAKIESTETHRNQNSDSPLKNLVMKESPNQVVPGAESAPESESSRLKGEGEATPPDFWTLRVEAIRLLRFNLDGTVLSFDPAKEESASIPPNSAEGVATTYQHNALSAVERDMLRTEGDPAGVGYTLKEALGLVRSTVAGQRSVALRLIAAVLEKAVRGLQMQQSQPSKLGDAETPVDWQAVWAYALGPEAELVLTLRLALDDGHSTVVAACARAMQALLSYSANESYFDSLEGLWPGVNVIYTAPIFRRKTKHDEGFIGSGRWKYNVKRSEMFPFSGTSAHEQVEEEGKDTVGEDGHIANKDVAAGLLRMGLLPRIRYILEVHKLIVADDALLCILISLARHSPAAAAAIMTCPRLLDTVLSRFIGKDGNESEESWSCQLKAVRFLKVLSQASRSNCVYFKKCGALAILLRPLSQRPSPDSLSHGPESLRGFYATTLEIIRFWRVCLNYRIGLSFFTDNYPTLCMWLVPLSKEEILGGGSDASFSLAMESYSLLENIARTLPVLHDKLSPSVAMAGQLGSLNWSWSVAMTMLNTALKWLSSDRISAVHQLLDQFHQVDGGTPEHGIILKTRARKVLGILAAVLHFLATVCEKIVPEKELAGCLEDPSTFSMPWLPTFVPHLGIALASCGLLSYSEKDPDQQDPKVNQTQSLLDFLCFCLSRRDNDSLLVALNCQHALVRVSSMVDKLICINKPKGVPGPLDQPLAHTILDQGLVVSAQGDLRKLAIVTGSAITSRSHLVDMSVRGGPAPGVGVGWGSLCGGAWSKDVMVAQTSARLHLELLSVLALKLPSSRSQNDLQALESKRNRHRAGVHFEDIWKINTGLAIAVLATPPNTDLVVKGCSMTIFHRSSLSLLMQKIEEGLLRWRNTYAEEFVHGYGPGYNLLDTEYLREVLVQHVRSFWLAIKRTKRQEDDVAGAYSSESNGSSKSKLFTVPEDHTVGTVPVIESLAQEFAGQRLPLPSHWYLSPLVTDTSRARVKDTVVGNDIMRGGVLEEVVTAGLAFFLGMESLMTDKTGLGPHIPLVRKIHSLSCVFVSGGDVFLQPLARHLIGALQDVIGCQLEESSSVSESEHGREVEVLREATSEVQVHGYPAIGSAKHLRTEAAETRERPRLDFEGIIDPSYMTFAEMIAEVFSASSFGDLVFGRQVALHLWTAAPDIIRLATWRVLADARVLNLLPPISGCCGQPKRYLYPIETDQKMLEAYVSAWTSGALDKAATRNTLPFRLAMHHLGGYIFDKTDDGEDPLTQRKLARSLMRSTMRRSDRQAMLIRLILGSNGDQPSVDVKEQTKARLAFLTMACEGDGMLLGEIQRVYSTILPS